MGRDDQDGGEWHVIEWLLEYGLGIAILVFIVAGIAASKDALKSGVSPRPPASPAADDEQEWLRREDAAFLDGYIFYRYYHDRHLHDHDGQDHDTRHDDARHDDAWHDDARHDDDSWHDDGWDDWGGD